MMRRRYNEMKQRCNNPNNQAYKDYGGRGIKVCARWLKSVDAYVADLGIPPTPKHTIDRIDNDKGYSPDNCRWALMDVQVHNQRNRSKTGFKGVYKFRNKYRLQLMRGDRKIYVGGFDTPQDAHKQYLKLESELYDS
jgi:hypothetical protein